jgi:hypothetical protein
MVSIVQLALADVDHGPVERWAEKMHGDCAQIFGNTVVVKRGDTGRASAVVCQQLGSGEISAARVTNPPRAKRSKTRGANAG